MQARTNGAGHRPWGTQGAVGHLVDLSRHPLVSGNPLVKRLPVALRSYPDFFLEADVREVGASSAWRSTARNATSTGVCSWE
jgi:hypothetical protein